MIDHICLEYHISESEVLFEYSLGTLTRKQKNSYLIKYGVTEGQGSLENQAQTQPTNHDLTLYYKNKIEGAL